jgi:bifunctional DNA-binding transcriptional regulator/antitoxin component of YhaV-PrlF toxin-antitoxin module
VPKINSDGTINIPAEIVKNMKGSPGDEIVFEEWLETDSDAPIEDLRTLEVSVMLRSEWDKTLEDRAQPLKELKK